MSYRIWIAALLAALPVVGLRSAVESPAQAFSLGLPFLVLCGGWLWERADSKKRLGQGWTVILALLFLAPVLGARSWSEVLAQDLLIYVAPVDHVRIGVGQGAAVVHGIGALMLGISASLAVILGRRALWLSAGILGAGLGGMAMEFLLLGASKALYRRDGGLASDLTAWVDWLGWSGMLAGLGLALLLRARLGWARPNRWMEILGLLGVFGLCAWMLRPPLSSLLLPVAEVEQSGLPQGGPGTAVPLPALDPWADGFMDKAVARGQSEDPAVWRCTGRDQSRWLDVPRLGVALAVAADRQVAELDPVISSLFERALHRVHLVGSAQPGSGPLSEALSWPTMPLVLEAPPAGSHWIRLEPDGNSLLLGGAPERPDSICVLLASPELSIGELYRQGRELLENGGCEALSWMPQPWRSRFDGPIEVDPGCRGAGAGPGE